MRLFSLRTNIDSLEIICIRRNPNPDPNLDHERSGFSHFHKAVGLRSFPFVVPLSFSYSGRATLILHCHVAIIPTQRSGCAHFAFAVSLSLSYSGRATLILHLSCRSHFSLTCGRAFTLSLSRVAVSLSFSYGLSGGTLM